MLEVIPIGTKVIVGEDIPGEIQAVLILPGDVVRYDVEWWSGRDRKSDYFYGFQIKVPTVKVPRVAVGFKSGFPS